MDERKRRKAGPWNLPPRGTRRSGLRSGAALFQPRATSYELRDSRNPGRGTRCSKLMARGERTVYFSFVIVTSS